MVAINVIQTRLVTLRACRNYMDNNKYKAIRCELLGLLQEIREAL